MYLLTFDGVVLTALSYEFNFNVVRINSRWCVCVCVGGGGGGGGGGLDQENIRVIRICENIGQLISFNSVKRKRRGKVNHIRHSTKNEPPLPVIIGLMVHAKIRKKSVVNYLANEGISISISYNRVKQIQQYQCKCVQSTIKMELCAHQYYTKVFFTTGAIDNIDHDQSPTTSKKSFHGTSISISQHPANTCNKKFRLSLRQQWV